MATTVEILERARERINDPERWTQGANARGKSGQPVKATSRSAVCWCAAGAIVVENGAYHHPAIQALMNAVDGKSPESINDYEGHEAVLRMFDLAIERAKS